MAQKCHLIWQRRSKFVWESDISNNEKIDILLEKDEMEYIIAKNISSRSKLLTTTPTSSIPTGVNYTIKLINSDTKQTYDSISGIYVLQLFKGTRCYFNQPLDWKPSINVNKNLLSHTNIDNLSNIQISITNCNDNRIQKELLGARLSNDESSLEYIYHSNDDIIEWVTKGISNVYSVLPVQSNNKNTINLHIDLLELFVTETNTYFGNMVAKVTITNTEETILWEGIIRGHSNIWGTTYKMENFIECLSNMVTMFSINLLENISFASQQR
jgi:hypothetical protein